MTAEAEELAADDRDDETYYVICWCGYERPVGDECGLPCV